MRRAALLILWLLSACAPDRPLRVVGVSVSSTASLWLAEVYACASGLSIAVELEPAAPQIRLRLGEPDSPGAFAYQIGEEEIVIAANRSAPMESLSQEEARALFTRGEPTLQLWVFPSGEDVQLAFGRLVLNGLPVVSSARVASTLREMSAALETQPNAAGILPERALTPAMRELYAAGAIPVLALTQSEPQGAVRELIACLQR